MLCVQSQERPRRVEQAHLDTLSVLSNKVPDKVTSEDGEVNYGAYRGRIAKVNVEPRNLPFPFWGRLSALRLKTWQFHSLETEDIFCTMAILHAGYATKAVFLVYIKRTGQAYALDKTSPLSLGLVSMGDSSIDSRPTEFSYQNNRLKMSYVQKEKWCVEGSILLHSLSDPSNTLQCNISAVFTDSHGSRDQLSLVFPMSSLSAAYTHKAIGLDTSGSITLGTDAFDLNDSRGSLDWSRLYAPYLTRWRWLFVSGKTNTGEAFGINLSSEDHYSHCENAVWIDGRMTLVGPINFKLPHNKALEDAQDSTEWTIVSADNKSGLPASASILLSFKPVFKKKVTMKTYIVDSDYLQILGHVSGTLTIGGKAYTIGNVLGIGERQLCMW